jgi:hypothetical protein
MQEFRLQITVKIQRCRQPSFAIIAVDAVGLSLGNLLTRELVEQRNVGLRWTDCLLFAGNGPWML